MRGHMGYGERRTGGRSVGGGRVRVVVAVLVAGMLGVCGVVVGCGTDPRDGGSTSTQLVTTSVGDVKDEVPSSVPSSLAVATSELSSVKSRTIARVLADLARSRAPMPIYGLTGLEPETDISAHWWPVLYLQAPAEYEGPLAPNPRVSSGQDGMAEVQLVLQHGGGWLVMLENFRGDLGEVSGAEVGTVAGHSAALYEVNGGALVQWSDGGCWYGVFGRRVPVAEVVRLALSARLIDPEGAGVDED
jgi:hypothetical protein